MSSLQMKPMLELSLHSGAARERSEPKSEAKHKEEKKEDEEWKRQTHFPPSRQHFPPSQQHFPPICSSSSAAAPSEPLSLSAQLSTHLWNLHRHESAVDVTLPFKEAVIGGEHLVSWLLQTGATCMI